MAIVCSYDPEEAARAVGRIIGSRRLEIERRWLQRVQDHVAQAQAVEPTHLRDAIPDYLTALARLLTERGTKAVSSGAEAWTTIARGHAITRVRIGFDIDQLVHEFIALRRVIREVADEDGVPAAVADLVVADLFDAAVAESVRSYVAARDYETRRVQAENVAFLTHELRNPLTTAAQAAALLRLRAAPSQVHALDALDRGHRRLSELIDGVLDAERVEAGQVEPHEAEIGERDLLDAATEAARRVAEARGLALEVHGVADRRLRLDPDLTRSAIQNLVDNAVKYTDAGRIEVAVEDRDTTWTVHVRDACHGLSPEELRTIFEPFRRGSTKKRGTGLGLAIARRAIAAQGGSIHAESPGPEGCHFWITLPKS